MKFAKRVNPSLIASKDKTRSHLVRAWIEPAKEPGRAYYCATDGHMGIVASAELEPTDHIPSNGSPVRPPRILIPSPAAKAAARDGTLGVNGAIAAAGASYAHVDDPTVRRPDACEPPTLVDVARQEEDKLRQEGVSIYLDSGLLARLLDAMGAKNDVGMKLTIGKDACTAIMLERQDEDSPRVIGLLMPRAR